MKKIFTSIVIISAVLFLFSCKKIPEKLISPTVKIDLKIENNKEVYAVKFTAGIQNENSDTALVDCSGNVVFHDADKKKDQRILSIPFKIPVILPFETGIIETEKSYNEKEIGPLISLLGSSLEKVAAEQGIEGAYVDEKKVSLELISYKKKEIIKLLKDKLDEKN